MPAFEYRKLQSSNHTYVKILIYVLRVVSIPARAMQCFLLIVVMISLQSSVFL